MTISSLRHKGKAEAAGGNRWGILLKDVVGAEGFAPPSLWSHTRCATRLRYAPTRCDYPMARLDWPPASVAQVGARGSGFGARLSSSLAALGFERARWALVCELRCLLPAGDRTASPS